MSIFSAFWLALQGIMGSSYNPRFNVIHPQAKGDVSTVSQTANTTSATASFRNPCDNADFAAPVWEVSNMPGTRGDKATVDISITDSTNGYDVRCRWDSQRVSACEVVAAKGDAATAGTKLLGHGFWVEAAGADIENSATYHLMEEWLCSDVGGSYPSLYRASGVLDVTSGKLEPKYHVPEELVSLDESFSDLGSHSTKQIPEPDENLLDCVMASWNNPGWLVTGFSFIPVTDPLLATDPEYLGFTIKNRATGSVQTCAVDVKVTRDYVELGFSEVDRAQDLLLFTCGQGGAEAEAVFSGNFSISTNEIGLKQTWMCGNTRFVVEALAGSKISFSESQGDGPRRGAPAILNANILTPLFSMPIFPPQPPPYGSGLEGCNARSSKIDPRWLVRELYYSEVWYRANRTDPPEKSTREAQSLAVEIQNQPNGFTSRCNFATAIRFPSWNGEGESHPNEFQPVVDPEKWIACDTAAPAGNNNITGSNVTTLLRFDPGVGALEVNQTWLCEASGEDPEAEFNAYGKFDLDPALCGWTNTTNRATKCTSIEGWELPCQPQWDALWCNATGNLVYTNPGGVENLEWLKGEDWWLPVIQGKRTGTPQPQEKSSTTEPEPEVEPRDLSARSFRSSACVVDSLAGPVVWELSGVQLGLSWGAQAADSGDAFSLELQIASNVDGVQTPVPMKVGLDAKGQVLKEGEPDGKEVQGDGLEAWEMEFNREQHSLSISQTWICLNRAGGKGGEPLHFLGLWHGRVDDLACAITSPQVQGEKASSSQWGISCNTTDVVRILPHVQLLGHSAE